MDGYNNNCFFKNITQNIVVIPPRVVDKYYFFPYFIFHYYPLTVYGINRRGIIIL